jgi:SNF2 family DNA or RNA helicase
MQERGYHVAFHSLTWDYELYDQFIRRVRRQGNHRQTVFVHRIVARGTIDEVKIDALSRKEGCQSRFLDAMNSYRKSRGRK